jgi:MFS transporter, PPP family, 3-phenylpropionic acid transporter
LQNRRYIKSIQSKALKTKFSTLQLTFWCSWCAFTSFAVLYFKSKGMTESSIGFAISAMTAAGILGQIVCGYICDTLHTTKRVFTTANFLLLFITLCFQFIKNPVIIIVMMASMGFLQNPQPGILDSWILKKFVGREGEYGVIRAWASFGFAVFAFFYGQIIEHFGWNVIFIFTTLFFLLTLIVSFITEDIPKKDKHSVYQKPSSGAVKELLKNSNYLFIITVGFIISFSSYTVMIFLPLIISAVGGSSSNYGIALFAAVITEVPTLMLSKHILKRINPKTAMIFAAIISIIQFTCLMFASTPAIVIAVSALQGFSYGTYLSSVRRHVSSIAPKQLYTTAQTLFDGVCTGLTGVISGVVSGYVLQAYGVKRLLLICLILTSTGLILLLKDYFSNKRKLNLGLSES